MALRTIILKPGECATLPATATVQSVVLDGAITATSDCGTLPAPSEYLCYKFTYEQDTAGSMNDAYFVSLTVGTNIYNVPNAYSDYNALAIDNWLQEDPQFGGIIKWSCDDKVSSTFILKVKVPSGLGAPTLKVANGSGPSFTNYSYLIGELDTECTDCSS